MTEVSAAPWPVAPWHVGWDEASHEWYVLNPAGERHVITRDYLVSEFDTWLQTTLNGYQARATEWEQSAAESAVTLVGLMQRAEAAEAALRERVSSSHWQGVEDSLATATTLLEQARETIKWLREYASGFEMLQVARLARHPSTEIAVKGDELTALDAAITAFLEGKKAEVMDGG